MQNQAAFKNYDGQTIGYRFISPDKCPICHKAIEPVIISGFGEPNQTLSVAMECNGCGKMFIARYTETYTENTYRVCKLEDTEPNHYVQRTFEPEINDVSPKFAIIWNQAAEAESLKLLEICGMGYRKSLEFLVKDFCILTHPDDEDKIKGMFISDCIKKYLGSYVVIQDISTVAFWLGNDESHYFKLSDETNLIDLKKYIDTVIHCISIEAIHGDAQKRIEQHKAEKNQ